MGLFDKIFGSVDRTPTPKEEEQKEIDAMIASSSTYVHKGGGVVIEKTRTGEVIEHANPENVSKEEQQN